MLVILQSAPSASIWSVIDYLAQKRKDLHSSQGKDWVLDMRRMQPGLQLSGVAVGTEQCGENTITQ